jgi:hypothetical protein
VPGRKWDDLNKVRCKARRHFRMRNRGWLKHKINEFAMNSKNKNIRDLYREIIQEGHLT